ADPEALSLECHGHGRTDRRARVRDEHRCIGQVDDNGIRQRGHLLEHVLRLGSDGTVRETWWEEGDMTPPAASTLRSRVRSTATRGHRMRARGGAAVAALVGTIATVV